MRSHTDTTAAASTSGIGRDTHTNPTTKTQGAESLIVTAASISCTGVNGSQDLDDEQERDQRGI